jgi:cyclopropane-fatty-acyl-phospholipid synthase
MKDTIKTIVPAFSTPDTRVIPSWFTRLFSGIARKAVFAQLRKLERGRIILRDGDEQYAFGAEGGLSATITVCNPSFYADMAFGGSIGAGEAYMDRYWTCDDLTALVRIVVLNRRLLIEMEEGLAAVSQPLHWLLHSLRKNTHMGSKRNVEAHYDLGNSFYQLWLDRSMTYSCNIFEREDATLEEAAMAKYDRLCRKLQLGPKDHVLEIGTGWGGFAVHAAKNYGCRVTTTTISRQQHEWAGEVFKREGIADRIELLFEDYRDLRGKYDKLVSIEMIEAVGHHFLDTYLRACADRLKGDGVMALQSIVIEDQAYEAQIRSVDFVRRYIFPGGFIPSIEVIVRSLTRVTDLRLYHLDDITPHYARTLRTWRERFFANIEAVRKLGYSEAFIRMWEYYLCYCEGAFLERYIGDVQMIFTKPGARPGDILP